MLRARVVSRHFLRRRARAKAERLRAMEPGYTFYVVKATRGPFRWLVERRTNVAPGR